MKNKKFLSLIFFIVLTATTIPNMIEAAEKVHYNPKTHQLTIEKKESVEKWALFLLVCFATGITTRKVYEKMILTK